MGRPVASNINRRVAMALVRIMEIRFTGDAHDIVVQCEFSFYQCFR